MLRQVRRADIVDDLLDLLTHRNRRQCIPPGGLAARPQNRAPPEIRRRRRGKLPGATGNRFSLTSPAQAMRMPPISTAMRQSSCSNCSRSRSRKIAEEKLPNTSRIRDSRVSLCSCSMRCVTSRSAPRKPLSVPSSLNNGMPLLSSHRTLPFLWRALSTMPRQPARCAMRKSMACFCRSRSCSSRISAECLPSTSSG